MLDYDRKILRFAANLDSTRPEDKDRIFILSFFMADDTISIYETPQRNSGITGGKFLERRRVQKPNSKDFYEAKDFVVGAVINVYSRQFILHDADEHALNHMEANLNEYPMSSRFVNPA